MRILIVNCKLIKPLGVIHPKPEVCEYSIIHEYSSNGNLSLAFKDHDLKKVCFSKNFFVAITPNKTNTTNYYKGIFNRNKKLKTATAVFLFILSFWVLPMVFIMALTLFPFTSEIDSNIPQQTLLSKVLPYTPSLVGVAVLIFLLYSFFKVKKTNNELIVRYGGELDVSTFAPLVNLLSQEQEKQLKKEKRLIKATRFGWVYAPDKTEAWLEKMENNGYNFYKMSSLGNSFYFIKGSPRKVKYIADYQNNVSATYITFMKDCGWRLVFAPISNMQAWTLWAMEYQDAIPDFYSDNESKLRHARKAAIPFILIFIPFVLVWGTSIVQSLSSLVVYGVNCVRLFTFVVQTLVFIEYFYFTAKSISYYFRVKKSLTE